MNDLVPVEPLLSADDERWQRGLTLVSEWLREQKLNARSAYADSIGWPYTLGGKSRVVTDPIEGVRYGATWLAWCYITGTPIFDAKRADITRWLDGVDAVRCRRPGPNFGKPLTKASKAHMLSAVSSFYLWAMQEGHAESNPAALVNRSKRGLNTSKDKSNSRSLSRPEVKAMVTAADNDPIEAVRLRSSAIISLLFTTGMRVSELCAPTLAQSYVQDGQRVIEVTLKGGRIHLFPVARGVARRIDAYLASRNDVDRLPAQRGQMSTATTPLFATNSELPMNRREVLRLVKRLAVLAELDDPGKVYTHAARHSVITEVRRGGGSNEDAQALVGHLSPGTTARYGEHILALGNSPVFRVAEAFDIDN